MDSILMLLADRIPTPLGDMLVAADRSGSLRATFWTEDDRELQRVLERQNPGLRIELEPAVDPHGLSTAIRAYFGGDLHAIDTLGVETGGTPFQREVWRALREIPCGTTISYGGLA